MTSDTRRLLGDASVRPKGPAIAGLVVALGLATVLPLAGPQVVRRVVDGAVGGRPTAALVFLAGLYLAVAVGAEGARLLAAWMATRFSWDVTNRLRERLAGHALRLDLGFHGRHTPGEMIERVDGDVVALGNLLVANLVDIVGSACLVAGVLVVVAVEDIRLGLALAVYVVGVALTVRRLRQRAVPASMAYRDTVGRYYGEVEERLVALEDIRSNGAGDHCLRRFHEAAGTVYRADQRAEVAQMKVFSAVFFASALGIVLLLALGLFLFHQGSLSLGAMVALLQYGQLVRDPVERMTDQLQQLQEAQAGATRISALLGEESAVADPAPGRAVALPERGALAVELDGVSFSYRDGVPVLDGVDLALAPGRVLGVVGRSGSGKTTLVRLLARLADPTEGTARLAGVDLRGADPVGLRRRVALVTQDVVVFEASVRDNLLLFAEACPRADDRRLAAVLDEVGLGPWLARLGGGLDSTVTPGGLSAGEAQLLALARVFLADPGLVILDEPSSRLDPATEATLEQALRRLLAGRTAVLVAHRLSSLEQADEIVVLEAGRVVERGARLALEGDPHSRFSQLRRQARAGLS